MLYKGFGGRESGEGGEECCGLEVIIGLQASASKGDQTWTRGRRGGVGGQLVESERYVS